MAMTCLLRSRWLVRGLFAGALVLATWPAWRVTLLGSEPTLAELVQLICATPSARTSVLPVAPGAGLKDVRSPTDSGLKR